jgi:hypothetical protein
MTGWKKYLCFSWLCILVWGAPGLAQDPLDGIFAKTGVNRPNVKVENISENLENLGVIGVRGHW